MLPEALYRRQKQNKKQNKTDFCGVGNGGGAVDTRCESRNVRVRQIGINTVVHVGNVDKVVKAKELMRVSIGQIQVMRHLKSTIKYIKKMSSESLHRRVGMLVLIKI